MAIGCHTSISRVGAEGLSGDWPLVGPESRKKSQVGMIRHHGGRVLQIRSGDHGLA